MDNATKYAAVISAAAIILLLYLVMQQPGSVAATSTSSQEMQQITPGPAPSYSCPIMRSPPVPVEILNYSGFAMYNVSGVQDYVIPQGSAGTIRYGAFSGTRANYTNSRGVVVIPSQGQTNGTGVNLTTTFYHQVQVPVNYTLTQNTTSNGTTYRACYSASGLGTTCKYTNYMPQQQYSSVNATSYTHQGIAAAAAHENIHSANSSSYATISVNVNYTAPQGTYWVGIGGIPCQGGTVVMMTIGNGAYSGKISPGHYS